MNDKPLLIRFGVLLAILALATLSLLTKPLKKGMDLAGGHSLEFEVKTESKADLNEVIDTLKERVDPQSLMNLEWRPTETDRFEVRMPAGSNKARKAKSDYVAAMEELAKWNVTPTYTRSVLTAGNTPARAKLIKDKLKDTDRAKLLLAACELHDRMEAELATIRPRLATLEAELDSITGTDSNTKKEAKQAEIDTLTAPIAPLRGGYRKKIAELRGMNIQTRSLSGVMGLYVSKAIAKEMKPEDVTERNDNLAKQLDGLRKKHGEMADQIDRVAELYTAWAESRGRLDDPQDLIRLIRRAGVLEFRIAPMKGQVPDTMTYKQELWESGPEDKGKDYRWFPIKDAGEKFTDMITAGWAGKRYVLLSDQPGFTMLQSRTEEQWKLSGARVQRDDKMRNAIGFDFDTRGSRIFGNLTSRHEGRLMAILLDDDVYSAPRINERIDGKGIITGNFSNNEARDLVRTLKAGSLRAKVNPNPITVNSIGPTLGAANIASGQRAAVIGLVCVVIFMAIYFLLAGMIANFALALNVGLVLAVMAAFETVFTLPGIAGLILTMGIAVDANVLIFERLREEQQSDQPLGTAIQNAYSRAFSAIIDGNITTLLTCVILAWVGSTEIRGFGITLGIGIAISLFTSLLVTRWIFRLLAETGMLKKKVVMLRLMGIPKINWIGKRRAFWTVSCVLIVLGVASLVNQGGNVLGIEFRQGARAVVRFNDDAMIDGKLLNDSLVEEQLKAIGGEKMIGQDVQVNVLTTEARVPDFIDAYDANEDKIVDKKEWTDRNRNEAAFAALDANKDGKLTAEDLKETLAEPRYQITTLQDDPQKVRKVIDQAFKGLLTVQSELGYNLLAGNIPGMKVRIPDEKEKYLPLAQKDFDALNADFGGAYRDTLQDYVGGVLMAFELTDSTQAMTVVQVTHRLRNARLQAGRDTVYVIQQSIMPLGKPVAGSKDRYASFAVAIRSGDMEEGDKKLSVFADDQKAVLTGALETEQSLESFRTIDSTMSEKAVAWTVVAIVLSWAVIIAYLWFRFGSVQWGLAAVVCLIHDTVIVLGLVGMCHWLAGTFLGDILLINALKINPVVIAAVLTVIGYSVNDTIVVFDRIRENRGKLTTVTAQMINRSVNQTLSRTVLTSCTTLLVVTVMYIWGGEGIRGFSFALLAGVLFGTYSSVAIASPLLMGFKGALVAKIAPDVAATETSGTPQP